MRSAYFLHFIIKKARDAIGSHAYIKYVLFKKGG